MPSKGGVQQTSGPTRVVPSTAELRGGHARLVVWVLGAARSKPVVHSAPSIKFNPIAFFKPFGHNPPLCTLMGSWGDDEDDEEGTRARRRGEHDPT